MPIRRRETIGSIIDPASQTEALEALWLKGWPVWGVVTVALGLVCAYGWKLTHPAKKPKPPVSTSQTVVPPRKFESISVSGEATPPDGLTVYVLGKSQELVARPLNPSPTVPPGPSSVESLSRSLEFMVKKMELEEGGLPEAKANVQSSSGTIVTPRAGYVFVEIRSALAKASDFVPLPLTTDGRNHLWGLAVKLLDSHDEVIPSAPTAEQEAVIVLPPAGYSFKVTGRTTDERFGVGAIESDPTKVKSQLEAALINALKRDRKATPPTAGSKDQPSVKTTVEIRGPKGTIKGEVPIDPADEQVTRTAVATLVAQAL